MYAALLPDDDSLSKNTKIVRTFLEILRWKERYSLVTNILHITPFRQKRKNRCGLLSHVEVSIHSMMRVAHGRSDSVESGLLSKVSMRNWRIGWGWKLRTTIGMRDWIENGRKICILYSPFIIYTIIATSHYTTSYMSVSSTWKYMWIDKSKRILASEILLLYFLCRKKLKSYHSANRLRSILLSLQHELK